MESFWSHHGSGESFRQLLNDRLGTKVPLRGPVRDWIQVAKSLDDRGEGLLHYSEDSAPRSGDPLSPTTRQVLGVFNSQAIFQQLSD